MKTNSKVYDKQYCIDNREKINERQKRYRKNNKSKMSKYNKQHYIKNKEYYKQYCKQWQLDNPEKVREYVRQWRLANPEKVYKIARRSQLKKGFNITLEQYDKILVKQNFKCAICNKHMSEFKRALAVDHDHETGKIRGLLCRNCNAILGYAGDNPKILLEAIDYLK